MKVSNRLIEGKFFPQPNLILVLVVFLFTLMIGAILLIIWIHIFMIPAANYNVMGIQLFEILLLILIFAVPISVILFPFVLNLTKGYIVTKEGLYIKKAKALVFIPRSAIKGFVYMDRKQKSGYGGGLLKFDDRVTIISVKNFDDFLETLREYGYKTTIDDSNKLN